MYDWLGDALTRRAEVITANRRLARILVTEFGQQQVAAGRLAWVSPSIFSLQDWLGRLASGDMQPESLPTRINAHQSKVLWERCLRRELTNPLSNVTLLVRQARDAWGRVRDFDVTLTECRESARGNDQHLFAR